MRLPLLHLSAVAVTLLVSLTGCSKLTRPDEITVSIRPEPPAEGNAPPGDAPAPAPAPAAGHPPGSGG